MAKYTSDEINFIKTNYSEHGVQYLADHLNRTKSSIYFKANSLDLKSKTLNNKKCDVNFLLSDSLESFYWNGFIAADGSFNHNGRSLKIALSFVDADHLSKLSEKIHTKVRIYASSSKLSYGSKVCELAAYDSVLIPKIMNKFDFKESKTHNPPSTERYTTFTDDQLIAFFIGFIDGDGCISKKFNNGNRITLQVDASWVNFLDFFNVKLHNKFRYLRGSTVALSKNHGKTYAYLTIGKERLLNNLSFFIRTNDLPVLDRKWSNIEPIDRVVNSLKKNENSSLSKSIIVDGMAFSSISNAARYFDCSNATIHRFLKKKPCQIL